MLTINLEKELSKQPASKVNAQELLLVKEYDKLGEGVAASEVLGRIGLNKAAKEGRGIKSNNETLLSEASKFNMDKVYHISQIEKLCSKYYLRFLPSALFKGSIDAALPDKIATFEATYNVQCKSVAKERNGFMNWDEIEDEKGNNTFIAAPKSSFKLEERPKDPLLFYKINDEYYYLIHKWGNDLSFLRRFYNILSSRALVWTLIFAIGVFVFSHTVNIDQSHPSVSSVLYFIATIVTAVGAVVNLVLGDGGVGFLPKNEIESRYL